MKTTFLVSAGMLVASLGSVTAVPSTGFTAKDRFEGFRFEITGEASDTNSIQSHVVKAANELSCFGWIQKSPASSIVGEARCNKEGAAYLKHYLQRGIAVFYENGKQVNIVPYKDTNIKLHFSDFRKLDAGRKTCFDDAPHACSQYEDVGAQKEEL